MSTISEELADDIASALDAKQKIMAIKRYTEVMHCGLREAKDTVERIDAARKAGADRATWLAEENARLQEAGSASIEYASEDTAAAFTEALFAGEKIRAVKIYRASAGTGLKDAKEAMDTLEAELRQECPERFSHPAKSGCLSFLIFAAMAGMAIQYIVA